MTHLLPFLPKLRALLSALIIFLPLVVGAKGPEPFCVLIFVDSLYMAQTVDEPYVQVTLLAGPHPNTRIFEGHTDKHGTLAAGFYTPLPAPIRLLIHRDTPEGALQRTLPLLDAGTHLVRPRGHLLCHATYDWDTRKHDLDCHIWH